MKGYSKINLMNSRSKSKSMDSSDQTIKTPRIEKPISIKKPIITVTQEQTKPLDDDYDYNHYSGNNQEQDENFSMEKLKIKRSLTCHGTTENANSTSTLSSRFKIEKQHSTGRTMQTAVKRVMSIRRSSSVSERYSKICDQCSNPFDINDVEEDNEELHKARSKMNMKKTGSILKACKRIFGL